MPLSDAEILRKLAGFAEELRSHDAETAFGATLLETAATALERLAASVAAHHRRQAIDRLRPDDRDR